MTLMTLVEQPGGSKSQRTTSCTEDKAFGAMFDESKKELLTVETNFGAINHRK